MISLQSEPSVSAGSLVLRHILFVYLLPLEKKEGNNPLKCPSRSHAVGIRGDFNHELWREEREKPWMDPLFASGSVGWINKGAMQGRQMQVLIVFLWSPFTLWIHLSGDRQRWWQMTRSMCKPRGEAPGNATFPSPMKAKAYDGFIAGFKWIPKCNINPVWHFNELSSGFCLKLGSLFCQLKRGQTKVKVWWICVVMWAETVAQVRMVNTGLQIQIGCKQVSLPGGGHECPHL